MTGYRRSERGQFVAWQPDDKGWLWSAVLGLYLVVRGIELRVQTVARRLLATLEESEAGRRQAEAAHQADGPSEITPVVAW